MSTKINQLHDAVLQILLDRIQGESASASDISNAIKFLKDNQITVAEFGEGMQTLANKLRDSGFENLTQEEMDSIIKGAH